MSPAHASLWKVASWVISVGAAAIFAIDPSILTGIAALIAAMVGAGNLYLLFLSRKDNRELKAVVDDVKHQTDGIRTRMEEKVNQAEVKAGVQTAALSAATTRADHAEGVQQERVEERARQKDDAS